MCDLSNFKTGYFILYKNPGTVFRNLIEKYQLKEGFSKEDSKYTHVEISLGQNHAINARIPKIILTEICSFHKGKYVKIVRHKNRHFHRKRKDVAIECAKKLNTYYGLGVVWFVIKDAVKRNIFSAFGDFCSELCGYGIVKAYEREDKGYRDLLPKKYNELYPADFLNENFFEVVWEGYIPENKDNE